MSKASEVLKRKSTAIMKHFESRARKEVASAFGTTSLALQDALEKHLKQLVAALDTVEAKGAKAVAAVTLRKKDIGKEHARDRSEAGGYSIDELIFEYRILRQVVIEELDKEVILSHQEREVITDLIEQAVNDAAAEFSSRQREMVEQFTAVLSHDLRGPISVATTSAELILRNPERPDDCVINANRILVGVKRMDSMIQNLLDADRLGSGQSFSVEFAECDVGAIAREVLDEMATIHGDRFVLMADDIRAWWSADLFRRALENLVSNAVKYGDEKAPIQISIQKARSMIDVIVHNEGNPIPENEISTLFKRYRRSKSAESSHKKGWGLGLTLVAGVVKAHGGTIKVESSAAKGTSFIMKLPLNCQEDALSSKVS